MQYFTYPAAAETYDEVPKPKKYQKMHNYIHAYTCMMYIHVCRAKLI